MNPLWKALARVREHGWQQYRYGSEEDGFCLVGTYAPTGEEDDSETADRDRARCETVLMRVLREQYPTFVPPDGFDMLELEAFNDCIERSQHEVEALLEKGAVLYDEIYS